MAAFVIVDIHVLHPEEYKNYIQLAPASLLPFQGKYIVRGGEVTVLEGNWTPNRFVILEFPTKELATAWWNSDIYNPFKSIRQANAETNIILVESLNM